MTPSVTSSKAKDEGDDQSQGSFDTEYTYETMHTDGDYTYQTAPSVLFNKRVRFLAQVQAQTILSLEDYTEKEIRACWYTPKQKDKMHAKLTKIVARIESGRLPKQGQTYRGLEFSTAEGARTLITTIHACIDTVMDEQDRQWRNFKDDHEGLAFASMQTTGHSKQLAYRRAQADFQEAWDEDEEVSSSEKGTICSGEIDAVRKAFPEGKEEKQRVAPVTKYTRKWDPAGCHASQETDINDFKKSRRACTSRTLDAQKMLPLPLVPKEANDSRPKRCA